MRPLLETLSVDISDIDDAENEDDKTATVERKVSLKIIFSLVKEMSITKLDRISLRCL